MPTGDPRDALLRLAADERVDLMVVGSHGRTGLAKLLLGSVSSHAVTHASCNVLVVKEEAHEKGSR
jgi:nucleotide-binding universal stress UspA family protein